MRRVLLAGPLAAISLVALASGCAGTDNPAALPPPTSPVVTPALTSSGATETSAPPKTAPPKPANTGSSTSSWPSPETCVSYDPNKVTAHYEGGVWVISDGSKTVMRLHGGPGDDVGQKGLALAQRYRKHCYLGRDNAREEFNSFIFDYWRDSSGKTPTIPGQEDDCSSYDPKNLTVEDMGDGDGWRVKDHDHVLHLFDTGSDARNGKLVAAKYHQICFIGDSGDEDTGQDQVNYFR